MPTFASRVRELRKARGLTQKQAAALFGMAEIAWRKYEAGERTPTYDGLIALADFFGVSLDFLTGRSDDH